MDNLLVSDLRDFHAISQDHDCLELFMNCRDQLLDSFLPSELQSPRDRPAHKAYVRTECQTLGDISSPAYASIDVDLNLVSDR